MSNKSYFVKPSISIDTVFDAVVLGPDKPMSLFFSNDIAIIKPP